MTTAQIKEIVENVLNDEVDRVTPLSKAHHITLTKFENKYMDVNATRVKFDTVNEVLEVYAVKPVGVAENPNIQYQDGYNSDTVGGINYKYLTDEAGDPIVDYYDFEAIMCIVTKKGIE